MRQYPAPKTEQEFERFCVEFLRRYWNKPGLHLYAKRGEGQNGVDIVDQVDVTDLHAAQCKHHEETKNITPKEISDEVAKAVKFPQQIRLYGICTTAKKSAEAQNRVMEINRTHASQNLFKVQLIYWEEVESFLDHNPSLVELLSVTSAAGVRSVIRDELAASEARQATRDGLLLSPKENPVSLDVIHKDNPPGTFEYVLTQTGIEKAYSSRSLRLLLIANLRVPMAVDIYSLVVETVAYTNNVKRVLSLTKPKGLYTPEILQTEIEPIPGARVDILKGQSWRLERPGSNVLSLEVTPNLKPGLYSFRFLARCATSDTAETSLDTTVISLFVNGPEFDCIELKCRGKHYDSAATAVIEADEAVWAMLKAESRRDDSLVFLGPSYYETAHEILDETWLVRRYYAPPSQDGARILNDETPSPVIWDSGVKVNEELYSERRTFNRLLGIFDNDPPEKVANIIEKLMLRLRKD